ncbi:MAG: glycoside hydrolase family 16 protein [Planctomycetota bacterium]
MRHLSTVLLTMLPALPLLESAAQPTADKSYRLVWSDEFETDGRPDPGKWRFESGFVRNQELQYYQPENASCRRGLLVIEARREEVPNARYARASSDWRQKRRTASYTSACLTTRGIRHWKYARIEVRARIDARDGLWPAIWTVGESGPWPDCGEIDIMEFYNGHILANACWSSGAPWKPRWSSVRKPLADFGGSDWASRFHTWRMDWDRQHVRLYVDDVLLNSISADEVAKPAGQAIGSFDQPHCLLLNLAVGGTNGGDPSNTAFPATFEVDFVRVFQR